MPRPTPLLSLLLLSTLAASPATHPTTTTTKPVWTSLAAGEIRYTEPTPGWNPLPLTNANDLAATYKNDAGNAVISIQITLEKQPLPTTPAISQQLSRQILKAIQADLEKSKAEILVPPKIHPDPRFLVRISDQIRLNNITSSRLHLYRALGYCLVMVTIDVDNQPPDQVQSAYTTGEALLDGVILGKRTIPPHAPNSRDATRPRSPAP